MIITQTPLRISFVGGGTDYPEHFRQHGGATVTTSIDKYVYIMITRLTEFFDHRIRVSYSKTELCRCVDEIQHPSVRECMRFLNVEGGIEIAVVSDLPARTGLGSSSCFTVGLLHALHAFKGEMVGREQLAAEAVHVERERIVERVGLQDQYACAHGGLTKLEFRDGNVVTVTPIPISAQRRHALGERLLMFYTGQQRSAHDVLETQIARTSSGAITPQLLQLRALTDQAVRVLGGGGDLHPFGDLMHQSWILKRGFSDAISNPLVDQAYDGARRAGAVGGKLLGAGGGGFLLLYVEPPFQDAVRAALAPMREVIFKFETHGSQLIFYRP
jgi:D-glycero-alpha-D-manno-heptose-7-phosphate kinase